MLFTPYAIGTLELKNRVVMPPMCMYKADNDGKVKDWHRIHYASRAVGQVGLLIVEATAVEYRGRISNRDLGIWEDAQIAGLKELVDGVHAQGGKIALQLAHAGRKSDLPDTTPVAPSALAFNADYKLPQALTLAELPGIVAAFAQGARRAVAAGFDAIEIHAAHGYLINEFLSPLTNRREDEYGGSPENRVRLLREILQAVREVVPATLPLLLRVSAEDYDADGNHPADVAQLINLVKELGIDLVNVSSGGVVDRLPRAYAGYQIPMALVIAEETGLPVLGGGLITEPLQAEQAIKAGLSLVWLGRELLRNPYWALQAAHSLQETVTWPEAYARAKF
ncbi:NADPH dehydrogenase NamA [Azotosporobacter soli]|uniref:NADPH dehydrogenase NamA n=1 Tax=Azotosporobacter soli TaxID=3055040 RepID=UPI0031FEC0E8